MAFDAAIYMDVVASEAIDGVDGFNFQAVSPGLTAVDQQRIREGLLHRVLLSWSMGHDELSHPPTCAYAVHEGRSYLARGRSTGATNNGRPGNQLTEVIVTSEGDDFVPHRPAQLYGARNWSLDKVAGTRLRAWVTPLEIRPEFEVESLKEMVRSDAWATEVLPHYLTMIDAVRAEEPTKLVLLHRDLEVVMRWIALGTLFVDADTARALRFRALADDPWHADAEIVGVSPEFGRTDFTGANVLDLERRTFPGLMPTEVARTQADWFLNMETDDALNAIEIAHRWGAALGQGLAARAARIVGFSDGTENGRDAWATAVAAVERLATAGLHDDLTLYTEELAGTIASYGPVSAEEFRQAGSAISRAHGAAAGELATAIALPTLEALAAAPAAAQGWAHELAAVDEPVAWGSPETRSAAGECVGDVMAGAPDAALPEVFSAARAMGVAVPEPALAEAVDRLAALWLRKPELGEDQWERWLVGRSVISVLTRRLLDALRAGDGEVAAAVTDGRWDHYGRIAHNPALEGWLESGRLARIPLKDRAARFAKATLAPPESWKIALADSGLPQDAGLWAAWITHRGLDPDMARRVRNSVEGALAAAPGAAETHRAADWDALMRSLATTSDPGLARLSREYQAADAALKGVREIVRQRPGAKLDRCTPHLPRWAPLVLRDLGWLLVHSTEPDEVSRLLGACAPWGVPALRLTLLGMVRADRGLLAIEHALHHLATDRRPVAAVFEDVLVEILAGRPDLAGRARLRSRFKGELDDFLLRHPQQGDSSWKRKLGGLFDRGRGN